MKTIDIIDKLPFEFLAALEADPYSIDIPIIVAEEGNVKLEMERKVATIKSKNGKLGIAVIVLQVVADDDQPQLQFGPLTLRPAFQVIENLELNRGASGTGKSARKVARWIIDVLKQVLLKGLIGSLEIDKPGIVPVPLSEKLGPLMKAYQVNFSCLEISTENRLRVQMPGIGLDDTKTQIVLSCPTPEATIWYTEDDSFPREDNPNAKRYIEPFEIPDGGVTIRARGYLAGCYASSVAREIIDPT